MKQKSDDSDKSERFKKRLCYLVTLDPAEAVRQARLDLCEAEIIFSRMQRQYTNMQNQKQESLDKGLQGYAYPKVQGTGYPND
jgi:hypothetical protein